MSDTPSGETTRVRLLEATRVALARYGPRKLALVDIARIAGVSRPTLYKHFPSKDALLGALAAHERRRFDEGIAAATRGLEGEERIDAALRFVVTYQEGDPIQHLVTVEPGFVLAQVGAALDVMELSLRDLFESVPDYSGRRASERPDDLADLVVRTALSHFLIPAREPQRLLRELRTLVGITESAAAPG